MWIPDLLAMTLSQCVCASVKLHPAQDAWFVLAYPVSHVMTHERHPAAAYAFKPEALLLLRSSFFVRGNPHPASMALCVSRSSTDLPFSQHTHMLAAAVPLFSALVSLALTFFPFVFLCPTAATSVSCLSLHPAASSCSHQTLWHQDPTSTVLIRCCACASCVLLSVCSLCCALALHACISFSHENPFDRLVVLEIRL